ncbi:hypothetical protein CC78DRAFT_578184 [Lojkania enalia]|uniref:Uncharacterized protein n=1 Tax=Lojkania enalia TaxID=147567 RepID=A0A9P4KC27_9PLEO|nr:hypothetical protein CC78DRAFT_578184 [Didymosphaeria enalia]
MRRSPEIAGCLTLLEQFVLGNKDRTIADRIIGGLATARLHKPTLDTGACAPGFISLRAPQPMTAQQALSTIAISCPTTMRNLGPAVTSSRLHRLLYIHIHSCRCQRGANGRRRLSVCLQYYAVEHGAETGPQKPGRWTGTEQNRPSGDFRIRPHNLLRLPPGD